MSLEATLVQVLKTQCPRVMLDGTAEIGTPKPYIVWQSLGGTPLRYVEGTAATKRLVLVQIASWDKSLAGALALAAAVEQALCTSSLLTVRVLTEITTLSEPGLQPPEYGASQDFEVLGPR